MNCLLPEIAMKRYLRRKEVKDMKDPQYILDAQEAKKQRDAEKEQRARDRALRGGRGGRGCRGGRVPRGVGGAGEARGSLRGGRGRSGPASLERAPCQWPPAAEAEADAGAGAGVGVGVLVGVGQDVWVEDEFPRDTGRVDPHLPSPARPSSPLPAPASSPSRSPPFSHELDPPDRWDLSCLKIYADFADRPRQWVATAAIPPDGACLFGALAHQLFGFRPESEEHKRATCKVRANVADYVGRHYDYFSSFLPEILAERSNIWQPYIDGNFLYYDESTDTFTVFDPEDAFQQFVNDLRKLYFFGSGECIIAAAEHYRIKIELHQRADTPVTPVTPKNQLFDDVVHILFDLEKLHYDSVIKVQSETVWSRDMRSDRIRALSSDHAGA